MHGFKGIRVMKKETKTKLITYATIGAMATTGICVTAAANHVGYSKYIVKPGDTLSEICDDRYGDFTVYDVVARRNHIEIYLPHSIHGIKYNENKEYIVQKEDTLYDICIREYDDASLATRLAVFNGIRDANIIRAGDTIMIPPYETLIEVKLPRTMRLK